MTQPTPQQTTATRLELYLVWLALRRVARSSGAVAEPLQQAIAVFLDRIDVLLELDIDPDHRREIAEVLVVIRGARLADGALRRACARLADRLALVLSEPRLPVRSPRIDQITYVRLLQLAVHISENEHGGGEELWAEQLAARANVSLDRVHAAIARMLADGVVHLPGGDDHGRPDAFYVNDPATADKVLFAPDVDREWHARREPDPQDRGGDAAFVAPDPRQVVVVHGRGTPRTAFFFELLRRLDLRPLAIDEVSPSITRPSITEVMRAAFARAQAVIVLVTSDDLASLRTDLLGAPPQPHLRVIFEAGVAVALQHARTIIVEVPPLRGLLELPEVHVVRFATGSAEERAELVRRLRAAGCELEAAGSTWQDLAFPPPLSPST